MTCLIYAIKKVKTLETDLNTDLKNNSLWFKANRLPLNIKKSQLIIFHSKSKKVDFTRFSIKLVLYIVDVHYVLLLLSYLFV